MTAIRHSLIEIRCDHCDKPMERDDEGVLLWDTRAQAADSYGIAKEPDDLGRWEIPADTNGPDLCPDCICARDGHLPDTLNVTSPRTGAPLVVCQRCQRFLPTANEFAPVPATELPAGTPEAMDPLPGITPAGTP